MALADDVWKELCAAEEASKASEKRKKKAGVVTFGGPSKGKRSSGKKATKAKATAMAFQMPLPPPVAAGGEATSVGNALVLRPPEAEAVKAAAPEELERLLVRPVQQTGDSDSGTRRRALEVIAASVLSTAVPEGVLANIFEYTAKPLFKRFEDPVERCRDLGIAITAHFLSHVKNLTSYLPYLFPAVMRRIPPSYAYDAEVQVFVHDTDAHDAWKRGRATSRIDKQGTTDRPQPVKVVEPSEEVRLKLVKLVGGLIDAFISRGASTLLHPYFHDCILFLQAQLRDPFAEVKVEACRVLTVLCRSAEYNQGMIIYALALARAGLPHLRHRHAKVRAAAVQFVRAAICVPFKAKWRGAGTDAIVDLIGFQAEDTIPIAAFYTGHLTVNYLAELTGDPVAAVRVETARMLGEFLTELMDRYDHKTRLVPYALNAVNDSCAEVVEVAMAALALAGQEYEKENQDEIVERRQYGVDGDRRVNHDRALPAPFVERPRLGTRLYVRGATRRFLRPLLRELTSWLSKTRIQSAILFRTCIVYCEESLTQDLHMLVPDLCSAFKALQDPRDPEAREAAAIVVECCELLGSFIVPENFVQFMLPRFLGDLEVLPGGVDNQGRALVLRVGNSMMRGARPGELLKHVKSIVDALTNEEVTLSSTHDDLQHAALEAMEVVVQAIASKGPAAFEGQFLATGRLETKAVLLRQMVKALLFWRHREDQRTVAHATLCQLAQCGGNHSSAASAPLPLFLADHAKDLAREVVDKAIPQLDLAVPTLADVVGEELLPLLLEAAPTAAAERVEWLRTAVDTLNVFSRYWGAAAPAVQEWEARDKSDWASAWLASLRRCLASFTEWGATAEGELGLLPLLGSLSSSSLALCRHVVGGPETTSPGLALVCDVVTGVCQSAAALGSALDRSVVRDSVSAVLEDLAWLVQQIASNAGLAAAERHRLVDVYGQVLGVGAASSRIRPFTKQSTVAAPGWLALGVQAWDYLLARQEDPVAEVRRAAAETLRGCLHFIVPTNTSGSNGALDTPGLSLEGVVRDVLGCLSRLQLVGADAGPQDDLVGIMDCLLREAAVLDPTAFREALDAQSDHLTVDPDFHASLVDHVELLTLLSQPKA